MDLDMQFVIKMNMEQYGFSVLFENLFVIFDNKFFVFGVLFDYVREDDVFIM